MNRREQKRTIVQILLDCANMPCEATFYYPRIGLWIKDANAILVKKLWSYNTDKKESRYTYKLHFVKIDNGTHHHENTIASWDVLDSGVQQEISDHLHNVILGQNKKIGALWYFSLKYNDVVMHK